MRRRGMVTSPHPLASEAGIEVLQQGGNAIEAAIAIGATLAVTYPHFCGLGGDAVWLVAEPDGRQICFLGVGQSAAACGEPSNIPVRGGRSALTTACVVDSWGRAWDYSRRAGGRIGWAALLERAIGHVTAEGFPVEKAVRETSLAGVPAGRGRCVARLRAIRHAGRHRHRSRAHSSASRRLAETLKAVASGGAREFYDGALARRLAEGSSLPPDRRSPLPTSR